MKRILFLVLWTIPILGVPHAHAIEIYVNGHKYDSIEAYQLSKKGEVAAPAVPAVLDSQQEDYIQQEAKKLGIDVDLSKVKTVQVNPNHLSAATRHQLYVMSVENGVVGALKDFYQTRGVTDFQLTRRISSAQLQRAIQQAVTGSKDPKLLIAEPGKMRIMALTARQTDK